MQKPYNFVFMEIDREVIVTGKGGHYWYNLSVILCDIF